MASELTMRVLLFTSDEVRKLRISGHFQLILLYSFEVLYMYADSLIQQFCDVVDRTVLPHHCCLPVL